MTATTHQAAVHRISRSFFKCFTPPTELERIEAHLEAALDCARDTSKSEADRMRELRTRIKLMPTGEI
jgi:hypothetical protein